MELKTPWGTFAEYDPNIFSSETANLRAEELEVYYKKEVGKPPTMRILRHEETIIEEKLISNE